MNNLSSYCDWVSWCKNKSFWQRFTCTEIIYSSRTEKEEGKSIGAKFVTFDQLLTDSDIIIITTSFNDDTKGIFNKEAFEKMKTTAFIVNTSRGGLINQPDLIEALKVLIVSK